MTILTEIIFRYLIPFFSLSFLISSKKLFGPNPKLVRLKPFYPDKIVYIPEEEAIITLTDPDLNFDSQVIDKVEVSVFSDSDPAGIRIILTETKSDSGIFKGSVILTKEPSQGLKLHVEPHDRIIARYVDESADPRKLEEWVWGKPTRLTVKAKARVVPEHGVPITIIELATINPETGEKVEKVEAGKSVLITAGLINLWSIGQEVLCIIQVKAANGYVCFINWYGTNFNKWSFDPGSFGKSINCNNQ